MERAGIGADVITGGIRGLLVKELKTGWTGGVVTRL